MDRPRDIALLNQVICTKTLSVNLLVFGPFPRYILPRFLHYQELYRLKKPKLEIVQYSNRYYYAFVSLIPSDFAIRVISIGFLQRILFGENLDNFDCVLWYLILLYFVLWRLTYSENYGDFCWGYQQYHKLEQNVLQKRCPWMLMLIRGLNVMFYMAMPSGFMYFGNFHRELYPKILVLLNNAVLLLVFIILLFVFNRHLDGQNHEKMIQFAMDDDDEDMLLVLWQTVLGIAWAVYVVALYIFHSEGTKHLEEQLENLIPQYDDVVDESYR